MEAHPRARPDAAARRRLAEARRVELRGCRVADVARGRLHPEGVRVVVEGGRIAALPGVPGEPEPPADLSVDLGGRTVVPALVNSHAHLALPLPAVALSLREMGLAKRYGRRQVWGSLADCLERGVATVRDAWTEDLRVLDRLEGAIRDGRLGGPRIRRSVMVSQPGGTITEGRGLASRLFHRAVGLPWVDHGDAGAGVVVFPREATPREVRAAVDRAVDERGAQTIKVYDQRERRLTYEPGATLMTQAQLDALVDQARRRGVPTTMHHLSRESFRRGVRAGVTSLVHLPLDGPLAEADLRAFAEGYVMVEPTASLAYFYSFYLAGDRGHPRLERLRALRTASHRARCEELWLPELRPLVRQGLERAERGEARLGGLLDLGPVYRFFGRLVSHGMDNLCRIYDAGGAGRLACGNDAGAAPGAPAALDLELEMLAFCLEEDGPRRFGGAEALRVATVGGADALGLGERIGRVERGLEADLAVLDRDPFEDPGILGRPVAALWLGGDLVVDRVGLEPRPAS